MDETATFSGIFGEHRRRSAAGGRLRIRDAAVVADLQARISALAAGLNRTRQDGWLIDFSPTRTDDLTGRSMFEARLTSPRHGERCLALALGRDWVEIGGEAMASAARGDVRGLQGMLDEAFRRVVMAHRPAADPAPAAILSP